jgi:Holliday junction resolvase-like predicted endonuclease
MRALGLVRCPPCLARTFAAGTVRTDPVRAITSPLVDHPVVSSSLGRTRAAWRATLGAWGENLAEQSLRQRGYRNVISLKRHGNQGIDLVALKSNPNGRLSDVRFIEVKTTRTDTPRLGQTQMSGRQLSRKWIADRLYSAWRSNDQETKRLAFSIHRFAKTTGRPLETMGEIIHIDPRTGALTGYAADRQTVLYSQSSRDLLSQLRRSSSAPTRDFAARHLAAWPSILETTESQFMRPTSPQINRILATNSARLSSLGTKRRNGVESFSAESVRPARAWNSGGC